VIDNIWEAWEYWKYIIILKNIANVFPFSFIISMGDTVFAHVLTFLGSFGGAEWQPIPTRVDCSGKLEFCFLSYSNLFFKFSI